MTFDYWSAIFGAFGLGVLTLFFELYKYRKNRKDRLKKESFEQRSTNVTELFTDIFEYAIKVQDIIEKLLHTLTAGRIIIVKLENNGGIPQLGTDQYGSVLYEAINERYTPPNGTVVPIKADYQRVPLDKYYQEMVMEMIRTNLVAINPDNMDELSFLRPIYKKFKVHTLVCVDLNHIPHVPKMENKPFMLFMAIHFMEPMTVTDTIRADLFVAQTKIKKIFNLFYTNQNEL